jgi:predicted nucleic acid-binding protein
VVAADSSSLIAFFGGGAGDDVDLVIAALQGGALCISPIVLAEVLSEPNMTPAEADVIERLPILGLMDGYWIRAAANRRTLLSRKLRARLPDTLIVQSCIDHDVALIQRDDDFRHFAKYCGLKLA